MIIPIEQEVQYTEWIMVNVPDNDDNIIHLNRDSDDLPGPKQLDPIISTIVTDNSNLTMFTPKSKVNGIYENVNIFTTPNCLKAKSSPARHMRTKQAK